PPRSVFTFAQWQTCHLERHYTFGVGKSASPSSTRFTTAGMGRNRRQPSLSSPSGQIWSTRGVCDYRRCAITYGTVSRSLSQIITRIRLRPTACGDTLPWLYCSRLWVEAVFL